MNRKLCVAAALVAGFGLTIAPAATSSAATGSADRGSAATVAASGDAIAVTLDASEVSSARQGAASARAGKKEDAGLKELRRELSKRAAKNGQTYLESDTESFALSPKVSMAIPKGLVVRSITVRTQGDKIVADVESQDTTATQTATQGQGMASWTIASSGTWVIKISGAGFMESKWLKRRLANDGSGTYDYVAMRRTGLGQPYEISGLNYAVTGLYISTHATDGTKGNVVDRIDQSPSQDFTGNCSGSYNIGVSALGVSAGGTFADCDRNDISFSATEKAYFRNYMTQGAVFNGGNRSVGFQIAVKIKQGKALNFTSYQRLEMARYVYPAKTCSTWDANRTC